MASQLARAKLARLARALNERGRGYLPPLIFMTDDIRVSDPGFAIRHLPLHTAVILRHRDEAMRVALATALVPLVKARNLVFLIAGDAALAQKIAADGVHFSERDAGRAAHCRALRPDWLITMAAHSQRAILKAARAGADAAILAPAFPTKSHPGKDALGAMRIRAMAVDAPLPVYALGGITARNAERLRDSGFSGIASIEGLLAD